MQDKGVRRAFAGQRQIRFFAVQNRGKRNPHRGMRNTHPLFILKNHRERQRLSRFQPADIAEQCDRQTAGAPAFKIIASQLNENQTEDEDQQQRHGESTLKLFNRNRDFFQDLRQYGVRLPIGTQT